MDVAEAFFEELDAEVKRRTGLEALANRQNLAAAATPIPA